MLALAAIFSLERDTQNFIGKVVVDPAGCLGKEAYRADARFLVELAIGSGQRVLTLVDAALRHLPWRIDLRGVGAGSQNAPGQENLSAIIEERDANAVAIGHIGAVWHRFHCLVSMPERALTGTRRYCS